MSCTWNKLSDKKTGDKISLSLKLKSVEEKLEKIEERHAYGEINAEVFAKFSAKLKEEQNQILEEFEKYEFELSNPKEYQL